jgi:hypothetical protein
MNPVQEMVPVNFVGKAMVQERPSHQKDKGEYTHTNSLPHADPHVLENRVHLSPQKIVPPRISVVTSDVRFNAVVANSG